MLELKRIIKFTEPDFDVNGDVKLSKLMYHFQEIASAHADILGAGYDNLIKDDRIWVLSKVKFKVYGKIEAGCDYVLSTYPRPKRGLTFFRDYYLYDKTDNLIAEGTSHWCVINFKTRKLERADIAFDGEYIKTQPFEEGIEKIRFNNLVKAGSHTVTEDDLDVNQHVNNCKYADILSELMGTNDYEQFIMNFSKEAVLGDEIILYREELEENTVIVGKLADDTVIFQAGIK